MLEKSYVIDIHRDLPDKLSKYIWRATEEEDSWGWNQNTWHIWDWYPVKKVVDKNSTCWGLEPKHYLEIRDWLLENGVNEKDSVILLFWW